MINLHESTGLGWDLTAGPWICDQTHYLLRYGAQSETRMLECSCHFVLIIMERYALSLCNFLGIPNE